MIKIKEREPIKLSGLTSFTVEFPFNQQILNVVKGIPGSPSRRNRESSILLRRRSQALQQSRWSLVPLVEQLSPGHLIWQVRLFRVSSLKAIHLQVERP